MPLEVVPFQALDVKFLRRQAAKNSSDLVTYPQSRKDRQRGVDPGAGDTGKLVEPEEKGGCDGEGGMDTKKRGETDEDTNGEPSGNMSGMAVQCKNLSDTVPPLFLIKHFCLPNRCEL